MIITLDREDVCRLMMACTITEKVSGPSYKSIWHELHEKVREQLVQEDSMEKWKQQLFDELEKDGHNVVIVTGV